MEASGGLIWNGLARWARAAIQGRVGDSGSRGFEGSEMEQCRGCAISDGTLRSGWQSTLRSGGQWARLEWMK